MKELAEGNCKEIAHNLSKHLNDQITMEGMIHWRDGKLIF